MVMLRKHQIPFKRTRAGGWDGEKRAAALKSGIGVTLKCSDGGARVAARGIKLPLLVLDTKATIALDGIHKVSP